jgi:murein DD-endopeptidase MepM/ murein hydrolase activator NlpD
VGTPIVAVSDGILLERGGGDARGNYAVLYDPAAHRTYVYMHMLSPTEVAPGTRLRAGRRVGRLGCTGSCFGAHLHFEVRLGRGASARAIDPLPLLRRWAAPPPAAARD